MQVQVQALREVFANPALRRLELAWLATSLAIWGGALALSVYGYEKGGATAVGLIALLRTLPGAVVAPWLALLADRVARRTIMLWASFARAAVMAALAVAVAGGAPLGVVYALVVALALVGPAYRPAFVALLPRMSRTPAELASANVVGSIVYNAGFVIGSLGTGLLLATTSNGTTLGVLAGAFALAMVPLLRIQADAAPDHSGDVSRLAEATAGFGLVARSSELRELVFLTTLLTVVDGALDVLVVVAALGFLDIGQAGAGYLTSSWGVGCVAGSAGVLALLSRGRLTSGLTLGALVLGGPLMIVGLVPSVPVAVIGLFVFGVGYTLVEVAANTLLQRLTPDHVLARVAGVVETLTGLALAFGSLAAGLLADAVGAEAALVATGALVPVSVALRRRRLARIEAGAPVAEREYRLLRGHTIFAPLPVAEAEYLARAMQEARYGAGATVIVEGEPGDRFYLIAEGELDADEAGHYKRTMGPGDGFGEIALLRDVPRTATVTARTPAVLLSLDRDTFLQAVTGQPHSHRAAGRIADERLPTKVP